MKFGKRLRQLVQESDEEWRPNFMDYKVLKKSIISRDMNLNDVSATNSNSDESNSESNSNNFQQQQQQHHMDVTVHEQSSAAENSPAADASITNGKVNDVSNATHHDTMMLYQHQHEHHHHRPNRRRKPQDSTAMQDSDDDDDDDDEDEDLAIVVDHIDDMPAHKRAVLEAERLHTEFFRLFRREVDKVNEFFLEKQEDFIIEHRRLAMRVAQLDEIPRVSRRDINVLRSRLTNFHGELVVLEKFSTVNYTGFRKILKKHDKKTGLNIQYTYLNTVLITPFFLSDIVRRLILSTEALLSQLDNFVKYRTLDLYPSIPTHLQQPHESFMQTQTQ